MVDNLDFRNPTNPAYYNFGPVPGIPLQWQNETTGRLRTAISAYLEQKPTDHQLKLVIAYLQHYVHAPAWLQDPELAADVKALQAKSLTLKTIEEAKAFIQDAVALGIDPL